jgi:uncharacterized protein
MSEVNARIASLHVYPVKSCAGLSPLRVPLLPTGLEFDRTWMVVDADREMLTQRDVPRLCLVQPHLDAGGLTLHAPGMPVLALSPQARGECLRVRVWDDVVLAQDEGAQAGQWIARFLEIDGPLRLVRFAPGQQRLADMRWTQGDAVCSQFSDGFPILVSSQASLDEFNQRLLARGHAAVGMARFRPNIVLDGVQAHDEDRIEVLTIETARGPVRLRLCKPCARCQVPQIDPATGMIAAGVGETLGSYRSDARLNGAVTFGMNAYLLDHTGTEAACELHVGQAVQADFAF